MHWILPSPHGSRGVQLTGPCLLSGWLVGPHAFPSPTLFSQSFWSFILLPGYEIHWISNAIRPDCRAVQFCFVFFLPLPLFLEQLASSEVGHFNLHSSVHDSFKENFSPESINYFCSIFVAFATRGHTCCALPKATTDPLAFVTQTQRWRVLSIRSVDQLMMTYERMPTYAAQPLNVHLIRIGTFIIIVLKENVCTFGENVKYDLIIFHRCPQWFKLHSSHLLTIKVKSCNLLLATRANNARKILGAKGRKSERWQHNK